VIRHDNAPCATTPQLRSITESIVTCETKTKDNVFVRIGCAIQQQPQKDRVKECVYRLRNPQQQIESYVGDVVRAQVPSMKLDEVFEHKDAIAHAVGDKITHSMADFGWRILQSLVINVDPDQSVKTAMNTLQAAEKQRIASETTAEAQKFVRIKQAEAEAQSKALQGEGISMQRAAIVNGLKDSIGNGQPLDPGMISELLLVTQYFDTLEKMADMKGRTMFIPHGISNVADTARQIRAGVLGNGAGSGSHGFN
jgi:regulator of protease activity HflC (stomatin/prohibitin superfamily)